MEKVHFCEFFSQEMVKIFLIISFGYCWELIEEHFENFFLNNFNVFAADEALSKAPLKKKWFAILKRKTKVFSFTWQIDSAMTYCLLK